MFVNKKAMASYGAVKVQAGVSDADGVTLTQMLFDGLVDHLAAAEGHMQRDALAQKKDSLDRALKILFGLQGSLDFERGGEVAAALNDLYVYSIRRLTLANAENDVQAVREVRGFLDDIRQAWTTLPRGPAAPAGGR